VAILMPQRSDRYPAYAVAKQAGETPWVAGTGSSSPSFTKGAIGFGESAGDPARCETPETVRDALQGRLEDANAQEQICWRLWSDAARRRESHT